MTDKTKRIILIAAGVLLCAALVVGIVSRLAAVPMPIDPAIPDDTPNTKDAVDFRRKLWYVRDKKKNH